MIVPLIFVLFALPIFSYSPVSFLNLPHFQPIQQHLRSENKQYIHEKSIRVDNFGPENNGFAQLDYFAHMKDNVISLATEIGVDSITCSDGFILLEFSDIPHPHWFLPDRILVGGHDISCFPANKPFYLKLGNPMPLTKTKIMFPYEESQFIDCFHNVSISFETNIFFHDPSLESHFSISESEVDSFSVQDLLPSKSQPSSKPPYQKTIYLHQPRPHYNLELSHTVGWNYNQVSQQAKGSILLKKFADIELFCSNCYTVLTTTLGFQADASISGVKSLEFYFRGDFAIQIQLLLQTQLNQTFEFEKNLFSKEFAQIPIHIGPVPLVLTPKLDLDAKFTGGFVPESANSLLKFEAGAKFTTFGKIGLQYTKGGGWVSIRDSDWNLNLTATRAESLLAQVPPVALTTSLIPRPGMDMSLTRFLKIGDFSLDIYANLNNRLLFNIPSSTCNSSQVEFTTDYDVDLGITTGLDITVKLVLWEKKLFDSKYQHVFDNVLAGDFPTMCLPWAENIETPEIDADFCTKCINNGGAQIYTSGTVLNYALPSQDCTYTIGFKPQQSHTYTISFSHDNPSSPSTISMANSCCSLPYQSISDTLESLQIVAFQNTTSILAFSQPGCTSAVYFNVTAVTLSTECIRFISNDGIDSSSRSGDVLQPFQTFGYAFNDCLSITHVSSIRIYAAPGHYYLDSTYTVPNASFYLDGLGSLSSETIFECIDPISVEKIFVSADDQSQEFVVSISDLRIQHCSPTVFAIEQQRDFILENVDLYQNSDGINDLIHVSNTPTTIKNSFIAFNQASGSLISFVNSIVRIHNSSIFDNRCERDIFSYEYSTSVPLFTNALLIDSSDFQLNQGRSIFYSENIPSVQISYSLFSSNQLEKGVVYFSDDFLSLNTTFYMQDSNVVHNRIYDGPPMFLEGFDTADYDNVILFNNTGLSASALKFLSIGNATLNRSSILQNQVFDNILSNSDPAIFSDQNSYLTIDYESVVVRDNKNNRIGTTLNIECFGDDECSMCWECGFCGQCSPDGCVSAPAEDLSILCNKENQFCSPDHAYSCIIADEKSVSTNLNVVIGIGVSAGLVLLFGSVYAFITYRKPRKLGTFKHTMIDEGDYFDSYDSYATDEYAAVEDVDDFQLDTASSQVLNDIQEYDDVTENVLDVDPNTLSSSSSSSTLAVSSNQKLAPTKSLSRKGLLPAKNPHSSYILQSSTISESSNEQNDFVIPSQKLNSSIPAESYVDHMDPQLVRKLSIRPMHPDNL